MNVESILADMQARMPWNVATRILKTIGTEPGQGWRRTIEKFRARAYDPAFNESLLEAIEQYNLCGEKFVKIYPIDGAARAHIEMMSDFICLEDSPFKESYPLGLPEGELQVGDGVPKVVKIVRNDDGIGLVFSHVVQMTKREKIDLSELVADNDTLTSYDEVIGVRSLNVQLFSVVWLSQDRSTIEVRTDLPSGMTMDIAHSVQSQVRRRFSQLVNHELGEPSDLYHVLERIYEANGEGTVVELGFTTTSASVKNEKMRRAGEDLRSEPYHLGGKEKIGTPIEPFRLSVRWYLTWDGMTVIPELSLIGTGRARSGAGDRRGVKISGAVISNCATLGEYEYVIERMRKHMHAPAADSELIV
ncbi:hypothetical protein [Paracoccus sp. (in: a-proteobacteria)]|uniref:hypothetical protein n=1 Tax=Paracoccus sp. TaxID=267 RepID=UPI0028B1AC40|nr:hypothetical protein [Paracoccus sp. (in: a-proteobacteria)]